MSFPPKVSNWRGLVVGIKVWLVVGCCSVVGGMMDCTPKLAPVMRPMFNSTRPTIQASLLLVVDIDWRNLNSAIDVAGISPWMTIKRP